jgi:hypothetical protein
MAGKLSVFFLPTILSVFIPFSSPREMSVLAATCPPVSTFEPPLKGSRHFNTLPQSFYFKHLEKCWNYRENNVTCTPIARQRVGKHVPAEANARNNRTSIVMQRSCKHGSLTIEDGVFRGRVNRYHRKLIF